MTIRRAFVVLLLICLGCSAQSPPSADIVRAIEREVRAQYSLPPSMKVLVGALRPDPLPRHKGWKMLSLILFKTLKIP